MDEECKLDFASHGSRRDAKERALFWLLLPFAALLPNAASAQSDNERPIDDVTDEIVTAKSASDSIIVPVPLSNPTLGTGGALAWAKFYEPAGSGEPWVTGAGALLTSSGNKGIAGLHRMSLHNDHLRIQGIASYSQLDLKFFGIGADAGDRGIPIAIRQNNFGVRAQALMEVSSHLYAGARIQYMNVKTRPSPNPDTPPDLDLPTPELHNDIMAIGPAMQFDTRDNSFNPGAGTFVEGQLLFSIKALGSDFSYYKLRVSVNKYVTLKPGRVIAGRVAICGIGDDAPFYDLCNFGQSNDLRGYNNGQYRDHGSWAAQVELRQKFKGRWGGALFAGIGGISPGLDHIGDTKLLPAVGGGIRFEVSKSYRINARLDGAVGHNSSGIYFSLGEAF
jgi:hypothetical protein